MVQFHSPLKSAFAAPTPAPYNDEIMSAEMDAITEDTKEKASILYALLPRLVRTRIRKLPSLRRSVSGYGSPYSFTESAKSRRPSRELDDGLISPPPEYSSRESLSEPVSDAEDMGSPRKSSKYGSLRKRRFTPIDNGSGIKWNFFRQGMWPSEMCWLLRLIFSVRLELVKPCSRGKHLTVTGAHRQRAVFGTTALHPRHNIYAARIADRSHCRREDQRMVISPQLGPRAVRRPKQLKRTCRLANDKRSSATTA